MIRPNPMREWIPVMRELREAGLTYQAIADDLARSAQVYVSRGTVWYYLTHSHREANV